MQVATGTAIALATLRGECLQIGTDGPICSMSSCVKFVDQRKLQPAAYHAMVYKNTRQPFKLPLPAQPVLPG